MWHIARFSRLLPNRARPASLLAIFLIGFASRRFAVAQTSQLSQKLHWKAVSNTAVGITGGIATSPRQIALAGHTYPLLPVRALSSAEVANAAQILSVADASGGTGFLYRTRIAALTRLLSHNTFCGSSPTTYLLLLVTDNGKELAMANFRGTHQPDLTPDAVAHSTDLCGTYAYSRAQ